jgi:hypothetical protein
MPSVRHSSSHGPSQLRAGERGGGFGNAPPAWFSDAPATPRDRYYGLFHGNESNFGEEVLALATVAEIHPDVFDIDPEFWAGPQSPPRILSTGRGADAEHCTVLDSVTPLMLDGTPVFRKAWRYLFRAGTEDTLW